MLCQAYYKGNSFSCLLMLKVLNMDKPQCDKQPQETTLRMPWSISSSSLWQDAIFINWKIKIVTSYLKMQAWMLHPPPSCFICLCKFVVFSFFIALTCWLQWRFRFDTEHPKSSLVCVCLFYFTFVQNMKLLAVHQFQCTSPQYCNCG